MVFAIKCWIRVPANLRKVAKVRMVARQPIICLCPWLTRGHHIISFKFKPDEWKESQEGASSENLSAYFFTDMRKLAMYQSDWPVEVQLKSKRGITLLRRQIVLGSLRKKMVRHLRQFQDFHMMFYMDFTAEDFEVVDGVIPSKEVGYRPAAAANTQDGPKRRRHRKR